MVDMARPEAQCCEESWAGWAVLVRTRRLRGMKLWEQLEGRYTQGRGK